MSFYTEPQKQIPMLNADVVVVGGGTGGVIAAIAAARTGAKTVLVEAKGYVGGIVVEGGTALHSFFNLWKAFPGVEKRQVVKGIPQEIVDRLAEVSGTSGHAEMIGWYAYDSICTAIDTELYKLVAMEMLEESGVDVKVNTFLVGAHVENGTINGVLTESRSGREYIKAKSFVDCTGYGDLSAHAGADYKEINDYPVVNSIGVGGVSVEAYHDWFVSHDALKDFSKGMRSGEDDKIVRLDCYRDRMPKEFVKAASEIGMSTVITTVHDDYFMFIKLNYKMPESPTNRDAIAAAELELRQRQHRAIEILREWVPGCEKAFIARTSPTLCIRRARCITCDYDITSEDVLDGRHFEDDIMAYSFHDYAPRLQVANGGSYGIPYRALLPKGIDNLYATGMMITSNHDAHMSTRNTVSCMGQGQAAGTAAALCAQNKVASRDLPYDVLRKALLDADVILEN